MRGVAKARVAPVASQSTTGSSPPNAATKSAIDAATNAVAQRRPRFAIAASGLKPDGACEIAPKHNDLSGFSQQLQNAFGTRGTDFAISELAQAMQFAVKNDGTVDGIAANAMLAVIDGMAPTNEVEAMLASQMAVTHRMAMELLRRARRADHVPQLEINGNLAIKLLRTFTMQIEALGKMRRGGEQTVRVEHVHVYPGGQAIVGTVTAAGGGVSIEKANQPHAKDQPAAIGAPTGQEMPCLNTQRDALPVASSVGQSALPDAWRGKEQRCAIG